jgi:hypothetical protein
MRAFYNEIERSMAVIEEAWQRENYAAELFPEIVWELTQKLDLTALADVSNQMKLMELPGVRIQQKASTFSDLYLQIFHNGRFMIEILNWWGGHVNVHDHDFSAVQFQLKGASLNAEYSFKTEREIGALRFGELQLTEASIWSEGSRSKVCPGRDHAHSVFHLGEPTTSLLIRTTATPRFGAQSNYFPELAAHYYVSTDIQRKKLTALSLLSRRNEKEFRELLARCLETQSLSENFFMMIKLGATLFEERYVDMIAEYAERGADESKAVSCVVTNNGIDFFKNRVNRTEGLSQDERLAGFAIAASHGKANFTRLEKDLTTTHPSLNLKQSLSGLLARLSPNEQETAKNYLQIFDQKDK